MYTQRCVLTNYTLVIYILTPMDERQYMTKPVGFLQMDVFVVCYIMREVKA